MNPFRMYEQTGPVTRHDVSFTGAAQNSPIPEDRYRVLLVIWTGSSPINLHLGNGSPGALTTTQIPANSERIYTAALHGTWVTQAFSINSTAMGSLVWFDSTMAGNQQRPQTRGVIEDYKARLEARKRERIRKMMEDLKPFDCDKPFLETPIQFLIKQEQESAIGGGGGETGSEALAGASPFMIGD